MEDLYPLTYFSKANNSRSKRDFTKEKIRYKILKHSNSETDFTIKKVKEKREVIRRYLKKKNRIIAETNYSSSKGGFLSYKKGNNLKKIIKKNKLDLSDCIENKAEKNLKLFGNSRYNKKSPKLFVEDMKKKISSKKMGLIPMLTSKESESDLYKEPEYIYSMQRNLSMTRRYQYNKKEELLKAQKDNQVYNKTNMYYKTVQSWWKQSPKIIKIQKVFKGFLVRKKMQPIFQSYQFMKYFENFLLTLKLKKTFMDILMFSLFKVRKKIDGLFISKNRRIISKNITENTIMIQNNFRCYLAKAKKNFLLRKKRGFIFNKKSFITKKTYVEQNNIINNIVMLQSSIKSFIKSKKYFDKNLIHKKNGIYYFEKVYLSYKNQKTIKFVQLMRHILQILAFKKKIYYKNPCDYDLDDINKVRFIQKFYLNYYYTNIKQIALKDIKKSIDSNNNIKSSAYITKERKINVMNKFLFVQRMVRWYIIKRISMKNQINKKYISLNYLITKENFKLNNCISKITRFQTIYKSQYKKNKNNIIDYEEHSIEDSSYDDLTDRDNKTLRQLTFKNKMPRKINLGLYISKIRKIGGEENINNNNKIILHQEGIIITKKRYYNNDNQIKKIQRMLRSRKIPEIVLQKPLTNNYNFYSINTDSYDDDFLYSKKSNNYDYQSKITKYNIENKVKKIQKNVLKLLNKNKNINIYKKEKNRVCFISKYLKKDENIKQINIKFLLLISLFIKKNIQQYIFYLLKNEPKNFEYPFCLNTINRVLKYLNSNNYKGSTVKLIFNNILKNLNSSNSNKKDVILLLNKEQENQLRDINICKLEENDCLDYIYGFSSFDKNLKNEKFLNVRLNNTKFYNTNIFTITKFIDDAFDNFVKGKYCYKCYFDLDSCRCSKEDLTDDSLDIGINDDYNPKNSIKFFEYNKTNERGNIINAKPKTNQNEGLITQSKLINNNIKKNELIPNENKQRNILLNSRKHFEALKVKNEKEKLRENILLRDDIYNDEIYM